MKFLLFSMYDAAKQAELAQIADKAHASAPPGRKLLATYVCLGMPFANVPRNTLVSISVVEAESAEAMAAATYPLTLAGATIWHVPVMELPAGGVSDVEKKMRSRKS